MADLAIRESAELTVKATKTAKTSTTTTTGVDIHDYRSALIVIDAGTWTDGTHAFEVQDSDDNSSFAAVSNTFLSGAEPTIDGADDDDAQYKIGYTGNKRYLRVVVTVSSATTGAVYGIYLIRANKKN